MESAGLNSKMTACTTELPRISVDDIISKINSGESFEACSEELSFKIRIDEYVPYVCVTLHSGHRLRESLEPYMRLSPGERWYEEDSETEKFIESFPVQLTAIDSRYEYDLNRDPDQAVYEVAWGKEVWNLPLSKSEKKISIQKYDDFYRVCSALVKKIEDMYGACLVYDFHSFNARNNGDSPVFNLGTENVDEVKFKDIIDTWLKELRNIPIPNMNVTVDVNNIFSGRGYFERYIRKTFPNTLVLDTEIRKIYCNEDTGELYPLVVSAISNGVKRAVLKTSSRFSRYFTNMKIVKAGKLLSSDIAHAVKQIDRALFEIVKNFEILSYINPVNLESEKRNFFKNRFRTNPDFRYRQLIINPFDFKRQLYRLPVESISDINIEMLFKSVIDSYADKINLISSIGTDNFLYNSLRYFGEPSEADLQSARFLLNCPGFSNEKGEDNISAYDAVLHFKSAVQEYGFTCKVDISRNIAAKVLVLNAQKTIKLRKNARYSETSLKALVNHEVGVHMLTTVNSRYQKLRLLRIGTPLNTLTQEGLAILSEYMSDTLTLDRLKELAVRVLAVHRMVNGFDFCQTFAYLKDISGFSDEKLFYITTRVFRGGGFTKDYLYLRGFREVLSYYRSGHSLEPLLVGKTSLHYSELFHELIDRRIILPPRYITKPFISPAPRQPVFEYLMSAILQGQN